MKRQEEDLEKRMPREVFEDHLTLAQSGELEKDLERNYAADSVLLTNYGDFPRKEGNERSGRVAETTVARR